jgi:hypothetical protein
MHAKSTAIIMAVSVFLAVFAGIGISNGIPNQSAFSSNQNVSNHHSISKQLSEEINSTSGYIRTVNQSAYFSSTQILPIHTHISTKRTP